MIPDFTVLDIETAGYGGPINRIGLGTAEHVWTMPWTQNSRNFTRQLLSVPESIKVGHNLQFDEPKLRSQGVRVQPPLWDTMLGGQLIEPDMPKALRSMAPLFLDCKPFKHESETRPDWYNAADICHTRALFLTQWDILEAEGMLDYFRFTLMPGLPVLIYQTELGLKVDLEERDKLRAQVEPYLLDAYETWNRLCDIDPRSPLKLAKFFYDDLGLPTQKNKDTGRPSVDVEALETLRRKAPQHGELIDALLEIRRTEKLTSTYLEMEGINSGMIHARFLPVMKDEMGEGKNKGAASTGRLGATPNLMNVPGDWKHRGQKVSHQDAMFLMAQGAHVLPPMRRMFVPRRAGDVFLEADYSQLELRIIAALSQDKAMIKALEGNYHETVRLAIEAMSGQPCPRVVAKMLSFLSWYGGGPLTLVKHMMGNGISITFKQAKDAQQAIAREFPRAWAWRDKMMADVVKIGYLRDPFGRKRHFYGGKSDVTEGADFKPQATGASMLWRQLPVQKEIANKLGGYFPLTMHDSYLHEVPKDQVVHYWAKVKAALEIEYPEVAPGFMVPAEAKVGSNWGAMEVLNG